MTNERGTITSITADPETGIEVNVSGNEVKLQTVGTFVPSVPTTPDAEFASTELGYIATSATFAAAFVAAAGPDSASVQRIEESPGGQFNGNFTLQPFVLVSETVALATFSSALEGPDFDANRATDTTYVITVDEVTVQDPQDISTLIPTTNVGTFIGNPNNTQVTGVISDTGNPQDPVSVVIAFDNTVDQILSITVEIHRPITASEETGQGRTGGAAALNADGFNTTQGLVQPITAGDSSDAAFSAMDEGFSQGLAIFSATRSANGTKTLQVGGVDTDIRRLTYAEDELLLGATAIAYTNVFARGIFSKPDGSTFTFDEIDFKDEASNIQFKSFNTAFNNEASTSIINVTAANFNKTTGLPAVNFSTQRLRIYLIPDKPGEDIMLAFDPTESNVSCAKHRFITSDPVIAADLSTVAFRKLGFLIMEPNENPFVKLPEKAEIGYVDEVEFATTRSTEPATPTVIEFPVNISTESIVKVMSFVVITGLITDYTDPTQRIPLLMDIQFDNLSQTQGDDRFAFCLEMRDSDFILLEHMVILARLLPLVYPIVRGRATFEIHIPNSVAQATCRLQFIGKIPFIEPPVGGPETPFVAQYVALNAGEGFGSDQFRAAVFNLLFNGSGNRLFTDSLVVLPNTLPISTDYCFPSGSPTTYPLATSKAVGLLSVDPSDGLDPSGGGGFIYKSLVKDDSSTVRETQIQTALFIDPDNIDNVGRDVVFSLKHRKSENNGSLSGSNANFQWIYDDVKQQLEVTFLNPNDDPDLEMFFAQFRAYATAIRNDSQEPVILLANSNKVNSKREIEEDADLYNKMIFEYKNSSNRDFNEDQIDGHVILFLPKRIKEITEDQLPKYAVTGFGITAITVTADQTLLPTISTTLIAGGDLELEDTGVTPVLWEDNIITSDESLVRFTMNVVGNEINASPTEDELFYHILYHDNLDVGEEVRSVFGIPLVQPAVTINIPASPQNEILVGLRNITHEVQVLTLKVQKIAEVDLVETPLENLLWGAFVRDGQNSFTIGLLTEVEQGNLYYQMPETVTGNSFIHGTVVGRYTDTNQRLSTTSVGYINSQTAGLEVGRLSSLHLNAVNSQGGTADTLVTQLVFVTGKNPYLRSNLMSDKIGFQIKSELDFATEQVKITSIQDPVFSSVDFDHALLFYQPVLPGTGNNTIIHFDSRLLGNKDQAIFEASKANALDVELGYTVKVIRIPQRYIIDRMIVILHHFEQTFVPSTDTTAGGMSISIENLNDVTESEMTLTQDLLVTDAYTTDGSVITNVTDYTAADAVSVKYNITFEAGSLQDTPSNFFVMGDYATNIALENKQGLLIQSGHLENTTFRTLAISKDFFSMTMSNEEQVRRFWIYQIIPNPTDEQRLEFGAPTVKMVGATNFAGAFDPNDERDVLGRIIAQQGNVLFREQNQSLSEKLIMQQAEQVPGDFIETSNHEEAATPFVAEPSPPKTDEQRFEEALASSRKLRPETHALQDSIEKQVNLIPQDKKNKETVMNEVMKIINQSRGE